MDKFVCVRAIMANAMDLTLYQFDYDMSFAVTFLNADRTVYGRYGSRQHTPEQADKHVSLEGLAKTMTQILALHEAYPSNKAVLAGKQPRPVEHKRPEDYKTLGKYQPGLDYDGEVAKSCVHCHQIHDAQRLDLWTAGKKIDERVFRPWPMPDVLGLTIDPDTVSTVSNVAPSSPGASAGLEVGDVITRLEGQVITSMADVQWVLHHSNAEESLATMINRRGETKTLTVPLTSGWRQVSDIAWRTSTWDLRRIALGGAVLESVSDQDRAELALAPGTMALRARRVGKYGGHGVAKRAGLKEGDIYVAFDGVTKDLDEAGVIRHVLSNRKQGDRVDITYLRDGKRATAKMKIQ